MANSIKRGAELLLKKAEEAYSNQDYYRALEIAMSIYGATVSSQSRQLIDKATESIELLSNGSVHVNDTTAQISHPDPPLNVTAQAPIPKQTEVAKADLNFKPPVSNAQPQSPSPSSSPPAPVIPRPTLVPLEAQPSTSWTQKIMSLLPTVIFQAADDSELAESDVAPKDEWNWIEGKSQLAIRDGDTKSSAVIVTYPPMASKDPDELYADALREADIDAKVGLNQQPKLSPEEKLQVDERAARAILQSRDFFEMVDMKLWAEVPQVERAFKKAIFKVHADRNGSPMAGQASEMLIAEYKKFKKEPRKYTLDVEKRRVDDGEVKVVDPSMPHEGYGTGSGADRSDDGFDCYGKRSYTWNAANSGPKAFANGGGVNPEGNGSLYASDKGEAAWLEKIEYSEATAHKFKNGKYQSFSYTGESRSKHGTRFLSKNNQ